MTDSHRMRGGALGALLTLIAVVIVAVVVFLAVDVFLFDSATVKRVRGDSGSLFSAQQQADTFSAADAVRIGREEAERVAAMTAREIAGQVARQEIAQRTGDVSTAAPLRLAEAPALSELSGTEQLAAREAKRVAQRIAREVAAEVATDELMAYVDSLTQQAADPLAVATAEQQAESEGAAEDGDVASDAAVPAAESAATTSQATPVAPVDPKPAAPKPDRPKPQPAPRPAAQPKAAQPATPKPTTASRPAAPEAKPQPSAVDLKPWWPTAAVGEQVLSLRFAGEAQADNAGLALLFTAPPASLEAIADHVRVLDDNGQVVEIQWSSARNPALVQSQPLPVGRYVVIIDKALTDRDGRQMMRKLEGPVFIRGR